MIGGLACDLEDVMPFEGEGAVRVNMLFESFKGIRWP
jgi:hypothetical protein